MVQYVGGGGWARCWRSLWAAVGLSNARRLNGMEVADHHPKEKEIAVGVCNTRGLTGGELALGHGKEEEICLLLLGQHPLTLSVQNRITMMTRGHADALQCETNRCPLRKILLSSSWAPTLELD